MYTDMITRIRNAGMMKHKNVLIPHSRLRAEIVKCLHEARYIKEYEIIVGKDGFQVINICLKYYKHIPCIREIRAVSKPSLRRYICVELSKKLPRERTYVLSTSKGVMLHAQAIENNVGGEVLFYVS